MKTREEEHAYWHMLAGECVKCKFYIYKEATFGEICLSCSRYYSDKFEEKEKPCK